VSCEELFGLFTRSISAMENIVANEIGCEEWFSALIEGFEDDLRVIAVFKNYFNDLKLFKQRLPNGI
jgi:hypothetical protein